MVCSCHIMWTGHVTTFISTPSCSPWILVNFTNNNYWNPERFERSTIKLVSIDTIAASINYDVDHSHFDGMRALAITHVTTLSQLAYLCLTWSNLHGFQPFFLLKLTKNQGLHDGIIFNEVMALCHVIWQLPKVLWCNHY